MLTVGLTAFLLLGATSLLHYEALTGLSLLVARPQLRRRRLAVLALVLILPLVHLAEMAAYAVGFFGLTHWILVGSLQPALAGRLDYLYFSMETFTSLGFGDVVPHGPLRFLVGIEVLNGLLLIAWSGSFIFVTMQRLWQLDRRRHG
jgi:hypothetical protein